MPAPGIVTGSNIATALFRSTGGSDASGTGLGVFGANPGSTPKRAFNVGRRDAEYRETMARLFVEIPSGLNNFFASISHETQALARVLATGGSTAGSSGTGFLDFLMTRAQESFAEKAQIVDTLTDNYVAFYSGQAPPLFSYSGTVLNTYQDDQRVWLFRLYREILRGTRLANRNLIARLRYDSFIVSGYLESLDQSLDGATDHQAGSFQFTMRVKHMTVFTAAIGGPTIAATPATTSTLATSAVTRVDPSTERVATITPDVPPTATIGPSASPPPAPLSPETRDALLAQGFTDVAIGAIQTAAIAALGEAGLPTDPRELAAAASDMAAARVQDAIQGAQALTTGIFFGDTAPTSSATDPNPESLQDDGVGGTTNVLGDVPGTTTGTDSTDGGAFIQELPEREGLRRRGGIDAAFAA